MIDPGTHAPFDLIGSDLPDGDLDLAAGALLPLLYYQLMDDLAAALWRAATGS